MRVNPIYLSFVKYFCKNPKGINISGILAMALLILGSGAIYGIPFLGIAGGAPDPYQSITPPLPSSSGNTVGKIGNGFVYLSNNIVNTTAYYDVMFRTGQAGNIATIVIVFPSETDVRNARIIEVSGLSVGSTSVNHQTVTYTIPSPQLVQPGATIRLEFANILNPYTPNFGLRLEVTTKNSAGHNIDSGMSSVYSIRQIETRDIVPSAQPKVYYARSGNASVSINHPSDSAYANCGSGIAIAGGYVWVDLVGGGPSNYTPSAVLISNGPNGHSWKVTAGFGSSTLFHDKSTTFYAYATCLLAP